MLSSNKLVVLGSAEDAHRHVSTSRVEAGGEVGLDQSISIIDPGMNPRSTYRRGSVGRLPETLAVVEDEGSILIVLMGRTFRLILGMVVGEEAIGLGARSRLKGVGLGVERTEIHSGRDQEGDWGERGKGWSVYITRLPGGERDARCSRKH
jgi:hypothetical protein